MGDVLRPERFVLEGRWTLPLTSTVGRRRLRNMKRSGLPEALCLPFQFLLDRTISEEDARIVERIEALRAEMTQRTRDFVGVFHEGGGGSAAWDGSVGQFSGQSSGPSQGRRSLTEVAHVSSVSPLWGTFLYLCAKAAGSKTILELGTAAGISGCYLASAPSCRRFMTVEGSPERARLAQAHLSQIVDRFELITASFDAALDGILPGLRDGIDLVFIDGSKKRGENLRLFDRLSAQLNPGSVILFDDIHWSPDLREDWNSLDRRMGLTHVINAGRFGVCVWGGGGGLPRTDTLYGIAGLDLYGMKQRLSRLLSG